ncbi:MAG TPA: LytTR family DNA-binding domain-containing protein [Paludibacteraceae bacterium]|nr:LytTR family DNA-binding domain-containing protein [Paludibacteraceae bacterium]
MKTIIIEDEQNAANFLLNALGRINATIAIKGIFNDPIEAIEGIRTIKPELIFLDIDLNHEINGFGILDRVKDCDLNVIFTTGYREHALAAFEYNAVRFLLKPYSDEKLKEAIERAKLITLGEQRQSIENIRMTESFLSKQTDRFPVRKASGDIVIVNVNDCVFLKPDGKSVILYFTDGTEEEAEFRPFADYAAILQNRGFIRIHQKFLVNILCIKKYVNRNKAEITASVQELDSKNTAKEVKVMGDGGAVILSNGYHLAVSRIYSRTLKDALNIF